MQPAVLLQLPSSCFVEDQEELQRDRERYIVMRGTRVPSHTQAPASGLPGRKGGVAHWQDRSQRAGF